MKNSVVGYLVGVENPKEPTNYLFGLNSSDRFTKLNLIHSSLTSLNGKFKSFRKS